MIKKISRMRNLGIFRDFNGSELTDFVKYNLIYGWNGSGKSTLSSLLWHIENKQTPERFEEIDYRICTDGNELTPNNIGESKLNIRTFNKDFVKENISWEGEAKDILIVGKENIDEKQQLDNLKEKQRDEEDKLRERKKQLISIDNEISSFLPKGGVHIKDIFRVIDPEDGRYKNYDKRNFEGFIDKNEEKLKNGVSILTDEEVDQLTLAAKPTQKKHNQLIPE